MSTPDLSPAAIKELQLAAASILEVRRRAGQLTSSVEPHTEYEYRALDWIVEKLGVPRETLVWSENPEYQHCNCNQEVCGGGVHVWDGTTDPLVAFLDAISHDKDTGIESATGTGKTFLLACVVLWAIACHRNANVITAAPKEDQLLLHVWKEIGGLWPRFQLMFPDAELLTGKIRMQPNSPDREKWAATAFVAGIGADEEVSTKAAGFHAAYMLWITEETPGMHSAIMKTIRNTRTGMRNPHAAVGNPDHRHDELHKFCEKPWVTAIRISALDHPNVVAQREIIPGACSQKSIDELIYEYGKDGRLYLSRVRGISPTQSSESIIRWEWCEAAAKRYNDPKFRLGGMAIGGDVANSPTGDKGAKARWQGACLTEVVSAACPDANAFGAEIVAEARELGISPKNVGLDSVGVGAGAVNEASRLGFKLKAINGGEKAMPRMDVQLLWSETEKDHYDDRPRPKGAKVVEAERYANLNSQMWWLMREDLRLDRVALPFDEELFRDLTAREYATPNGKITIEPKEDLIKRLGRSPDKGDATVYGNWVRPRRPVRVPDDAEEIPSKTPNRDTRLEEHIARHQIMNKKRNHVAAKLFRKLKRSLAREE